MYVLILFVSIGVLYKYKFFSVMHPNLMTFFLLFIYLFFGTILAEFNDEYQDVIILMDITLLAITVAHLFNYYILKYTIYIKKAKKFTLYKISPSYKFMYFILLCLHSILIIVYFYKYGIILLQNNIEYSRTIVLHNDKILFYNLLIINPLLVIYAYFLLGKKFYYIFSIISFLILLSTGFRALPFNLILIHIVLQSYIHGKNLININFKNLVIVILIILILLTITYFRVSDKNIEIAIQALMYRIFTNNIDNIYNIIQYYHTHDYLMGKGYLWDLQPVVRAILFFFPIERVHTFAEYITMKLNPYSEGIFVMTPTIVGTAFANFSYIGVFFIIFMINILQYMLAFYFVNKSYLQPLLVYITYVGAVIVSRDFASVFSLYVFPIIVIIGIMIIVTIILRNMKSKRINIWTKYQ